MSSILLTSNFKKDEEKCPTEISESSIISVCRNSFTGLMSSILHSHIIEMQFRSDVSVRMLHH